MNDLKVWEIKSTEQYRTERCIITKGNIILRILVKPRKYIWVN